MAKRRSNVTVITPSLPWRAEMLEECKASVQAQTIPAYEHIVEVDGHREGVVAMLNRTLPKIQTAWFSILADDDLYDPDFLETLIRERKTNPGFSVYYTWCHPVGRGNPNKPYDGNFADTPVNGIFNLDAVNAVGGWRRTQSDDLHSDIDFLHRLQDSGATFRCVEERKWSWRFHGDNLSVGGALRPPDGRPQRSPPQTTPVVHNITDPGTTLG